MPSTSSIGHSPWRVKNSWPWSVTTMVSSDFVPERGVQVGRAAEDLGPGPSRPGREREVAGDLVHVAPLALQLLRHRVEGDEARQRHLQAPLGAAEDEHHVVAHLLLGRDRVSVLVDALVGRDQDHAGAGAVGEHAA
jgi:hypothetical protein